MTKYPMTWEQAVNWLRDQPDKQELVKACFYDDPIEVAAQRFLESLEWRAVRNEMAPSGGKVLDLGAGRGISSFAFAKDGWDVTALEPDPSELVGAGAIRTLNTLSALDINIVEQWGEKLPFADSTFDAVHCRQVLHHAHDLPQMMLEVARVLKSGGFFIATREHVLSKEEDLDAFLKVHPLHHLYGGENAFTLAQYLAAIGNAGITVDKCLNPYESEINTFPLTRQQIKALIARRFLFPFPSLLPDRLISWIGERSNAPGRPYSFVGHKPT